MTLQKQDFHWLPYLHFGYLPPREFRLPFDLYTEVEVPQSFDEAVREAGSLLSRVVRAHLEPGRLHVVPLSGGLDSRALLAAALEAGVQTHAVTFGTPGSFDYEIGGQIAKAAGVPHHAIPLPACQVDTEDLLNSVKSGGAWTYVFHAWYNRFAIDAIDDDAIVLSGYLGEAVAGSHLQTGLVDLASAKGRFLTTQRFPRYRSLLPTGYDLRTSVDQWEMQPGPDIISQYEQLDFAVRQRAAIAPIVLVRGSETRVPFSDSRWASFMLAIPPEWRIGSRLYEAALLHRWPALFELPTTNHHGLGLAARSVRRSLRRVRYRFAKRVRRAAWSTDTLPRMVQYVDFGTAFRSDLKEVVAANLSDLKQRSIIPWIDPEKIFAEHLAGRVDLSRELQVLVGLEINLKADEARLP